jgi:hypothetical protein
MTTCPITYDKKLRILGRSSKSISLRTFLYTLGDFLYNLALLKVYENGVKNGEF